MLRALHVLVLLALALTAALAVPPARAADPVRGAALFARVPAPGLLGCMDCHSDNPTVNNFGNIWVGRNAVEFIQRAVTSNTGGMGYLSRYFEAADFADIAAYLGNTPSTLAFGLTATGGFSAAQTVIINTGPKSGLGELTLATEGDFALLATDCGRAIAAFSSCQAQVVFRPTGRGARSGALVIAHDSTPTPVRIALSGTAPESQPAVARVAPARHDFGSVAVGAPGAVRNVLLANDSGQPLTVAAVQVGSADFSIVGGSCGAGLRLDAGQTCSVALRYAPTSTGSHGASLSISHDGVGGSSVVALAGQGQAGGDGVLLADTARLAFGPLPAGVSAPAQVLTLVNAGPGPWPAAAPLLTHAAFRIEASSCPTSGSLAVGQRCQLSLSFRAEQDLLASGELRLGTALRVPLSGRATQTQAWLQATPGRLGLQAVVAQTARARVTVVNRGGRAAQLAAITVTGPEAADYRLGSGGNCQAGSVLAAGAACALELRFTPQASGLRVARLQVQHDSGVESLAVDLVGRGLAAARSALAVDAAALAFADRSLDSAAPAETLSLGLHNRGGAPLVWRQLRLQGEQAADFSLAGDCLLAASLPAGASCQLSLRHTPRAPGWHSASLVLMAEDASEATLLPVTGRAVAAGSATWMPDALAVDFGRQPLGQPADTRVLTLRLAGPAAGPLPLWVIEGPFNATALDAGCAGSVAPGTRCRLALRFLPAAAGAASGNLLIAGERRVSLSGTGADSASRLVLLDAASAIGHDLTPVGEVALSSAWTVVNQGNAATAPLAWSFSGPAAADYSLDVAGTCNTTLAPGARCTLRVAFHPAAAGLRRASLTATGADSPFTLSLQSPGQAVARAALEAAPAALVFAAQVGGGTPAQGLLLRNEGQAALLLTAVGVGTSAFDLATAASGLCGGASPLLLPGDSCAYDITWRGNAPVGSPAFTAQTGDNLGSVSVPLSVTEDPAQRSNVGGGGGGALDLYVVLLMLAAVLLLQRAGRR